MPKTKRGEMNMDYRRLTESEIARLVSAGCSAEDWGAIEVADGFDASRVAGTTFSGRCRLGRFAGEFKFPGGVRKPSGIYNATLHNVSVGDDARVANVRSYIANYDIGAGAHVGNVDKIYVEGRSSFGNGVEVAVLNETGGREVTIHEGLTAHEAYLEAMYRHRPALIEKLNVEGTIKGGYHTGGLVGFAASGKTDAKDHRKGYEYCKYFFHI